MQGVVLSEEFANAKAPMRGNFFGDTLVGPTILMNGTEEQKKFFLPKILDGTVRTNLDLLRHTLGQAQIR